MAPNGNNHASIERRTVLKTLGTTATISGLGFISTGAAASPTGRALSPDEHEPPYPDVQVQRVDRSVRSISAFYPLLTLPEDTVLSYIDDSDLSSEEKHEARQSLVELRRKFPVRREKNGNTTWLTLAQETSKTDEDAEKFELAHRAFADGASGGGNFSPHHYGSIHRKMTKDSCEEMGIDPDGIAEYADDPDHPDVDVNVPDGIPHEETVEDGIEHALNEILHHYGQYLDVDAFEVWHDDHHSDDFPGLGGAKAAADWHMNYAYYYCCSTQDKYLGMATHYPQDMGVPLHTGMGWEQANLEIYYDSWAGEMDWRINPMYWLHSEYEQYNADNWTGGHYLKWEYGSHECSGDYCYYPVDGDPESNIHNLADYTGQYSYDVYHKILDEGDVGWQNWSSSTKDWMEKVSTNCVDETGLHVRGFIHDVKK